MILNSTNASPSLGPIVVKIPQAMVMLSASRSRIYDMLEAGDLQAIKDGKSRKITVNSIQTYIQRRIEAAKAAA